LSHPEQQKFVECLSKYLVPHLDQASFGVKVLEVGSCDVNGSIRGFFSGMDYVGADLAPGPGVDVVGSGHELSYADGHFDVSLSCESFEHNPYWKETFHNMVRMTREGGLVAFTCASRGRLEHGTRRTDPKLSPGTQNVGFDYYRNLSERDFTRIFPLSSWFSRFYFWYVARSRDLYFVGVKGTENALSKAPWETFNEEVAKIKYLSSSDRSLRKFAHRVIQAPLALPMHILDDSQFQKVAIPFDRLVKQLAQGVRKLRTHS